MTLLKANAYPNVCRASFAAFLSANPAPARVGGDFDNLPPGFTGETFSDDRGDHRQECDQIEAEAHIAAQKEDE